MYDYISRHAAIDAIERTDWYHINNNGELVHGANSKYDVPLYKADDIYKVINGLPSVQRWIPVSERLPITDDLVLITYDIGNHETNYALGWHDGHEWNCWDDRIYIADEPIAWMPLPEPYEDGEIITQ